MRFYDEEGNVIASPSDERERGDNFSNDPVLTEAINEKKPVKSFSTHPHVLAPLVSARAIYPIFGNNNQLTGAVEVGYLLDTAFVDFSKSRTGLDVTLYTGDLRSATTIFKQDGVSRYVGTQETDTAILENTLINGETFSLEHERLGLGYYSAFIPVRDFSGLIIGMVSVGTPTFQLFEDSRQQLLNSFLILTIISLAAAGIGYLAMRNLEEV